MRAYVRQLARALALVCALACAQSGAFAQTPDGARGDERLPAILASVGRGVERYHAGLFGLAFVEALRLEELREDMTPKRSRVYVFESLVLRKELSEREGDYYAETVRRLKTVDGRAPKKSDDEALEERLSYGEALNFLLPEEQKLYEFTLRGEQTLAGRRTFVLSVLRPGEGGPRVEWEGRSFRVYAPTRWTFWADAETFDVLRVESHLEAPFEFESPRAVSAGPLGSFGPRQKFRYARQDYAASFRRVRLTDPEETRLVPEAAEWVSVIEGARRPRSRTAVSFSDYRRFRSGVKVVEEPGR